MKKLVFLFAIVLLVSCNKNENTAKPESFDEPSFLLSKIITQYGNDEVTGTETLAYSYDANNNPTALGRESTSGELFQLLEFRYTEAKALSEIIIGNTNFNDTYEKASVLSISDTSIELRTQRFDRDDNFMADLLDIRLEFEGYLIKSYQSIPVSEGNGIYAKFTHDDQGRLLSISNGTFTLESEETVYDVSAWDDAAAPDTINYYSTFLLDVRYWFPKHYISTKNATSVFNNELSFSTMIAYQLSTNNTVSTYTVSDDNPNPDPLAGDYLNNISKEYIEAK